MLQKKKIDPTLENRISVMESRLAVVETTQATMQKSVDAHEKWMHEFDIKLDAARDAVSSVRSEIRSASTERKVLVAVVLLIIFFIFLMV